MKAWKSVLSPPNKINDDGKTVVKTMLEWTSEEDKLATSN